MQILIPAHRDYRGYDTIYYISFKDGQASCGKRGVPPRLLEFERFVKAERNLRAGMAAYRAIRPDRRIAL
jgi:hypothetical protein